MCHRYPDVIKGTDDALAKLEPLIWTVLNSDTFRDAARFCVDSETWIVNAGDVWVDQDTACVCELAVALLEIVLTGIGRVRMREAATRRARKREEERESCRQQWHGIVSRPLKGRFA
jgi:hypothetical protein